MGAGGEGAGSEIAAIASLWQRGGKGGDATCGDGSVAIAIRMVFYREFPMCAPLRMSGQQCEPGAERQAVVAIKY